MKCDRGLEVAETVIDVAEVVRFSAPVAHVTIEREGFRVEFNRFQMVAKRAIAVRAIR